MSTITIPNIRVSSDLTVKVRLKDGGVAIDWSTLTKIKASIYSDAQRALAGRCDVSIDAEDSTLLVCNYAANKPQYVGVNRIVVSAKYMGETKTYDKPAFTFVRWTADQEGEEITIDDPDVDVEIDVEDISSSILQEAVDAAFDAADRANDAAAAAEHMVDIHTGPEGKSAYEVAVEEGYVGTEEEWLASLVGPQGQQGVQGETGEAAGFGTVSAALQEDGGDPSVVVSASGPDTAKQFDFTFKNLKGEKGDKGDQGNSGYTGAAGELEVVNNLTDGGSTAALSAEMGKTLEGEVSQLEAEVNEKADQAELSQLQQKVDNFYTGAYLDNTGTQITANGWGISDFVPYNGGGINYKWNDTYEDAPNGACIIFYNSSKTVIDYYSCAHATAETDGRTIGSVAAGTAFVRLSFELNTDSHIKTGGAIAWEPKTIKERVEALENHTEEVEDEISFNAGIIRDKSYSADSVIFTKDQVPAGNTISVKLTFVKTSGAIRVFDSNGNTLKTFAATGQTVGSSKTFDDYKLPAEYAYCAQLSGYSAAVRAEITIKNRLISEVPSVIHNDVFFHVGYDVNNSGELSPVSYLTSTIFFAGKKDDVLNTSMPMYRVYVYDGNKSLLEQVASVQGQKTFTFTNASGKYFRIVFKNSDIEYVPTISINGASLITSDIVETIQVSQGDANAVNGVRLGSEDIVQNKVAIIPAASNSSNGYMSREDKIKLDSISSQSTITIEGSGITKNASAYGFLPTNTAPQNSVALQNCLDGGGLIVIDFPGIYEVDATHFIDSNTHIIFGENVYLKRVLSASNKCPRHVFVNRGAYNYTENSNIIIENLKILPNGYLEYDHNIDSSGVYGLRGLVAFFHVKNLLLDGVEVIDHTFGQYSIHVCTFENAIFNRIHIETLKDGIHLGNGRGFVIRNCQFLTNDDAIAINAADYPGSNAETGWLEDGIIENITFLKAPADSAYNTIRGVLMLSGAWKEWESGMSFRRNGDYVTSDGKIYQTDGPKTIEYITSTVQPVHTRGSVTGADGLTWVYKGEAKANNAGFRRIHFRNLYYYRKSTYLFLASVEDDAFMRAIYPGSAPFKNENITFEAVYNLNDSDVFLNANAPIDNVRFLNNELRDFGASVIYLTKGEDTDVNVRMTFVGNTFGNDTRMIWKASETDWSATINLVGSLKDSGFTPVYSGITPTFINNDIS